MYVYVRMDVYVYMYTYVFAIGCRYNMVEYAVTYSTVTTGVEHTPPQKILGQLWPPLIGPLLWSFF